jgi:predicted alpha/beta-hydrolase family hydrolase
VREAAERMEKAMNLDIHVSDPIGKVSAILLRPADAWAGYILAHGAGAGMRHSFLETIAERLAERGIATLRYQFPYMESGRGRTDSPAVAEATVQAAVGKAREVAPDLPLVAGGKSFGGRMSSNAAAHHSLPGVLGLVFLGFPLHPPGQVGDSRAEHLANVGLPMLFLQGTRDTFADLSLITAVCGRLADATLHVVDGGDHSFAVLKRSGRSRAEVMDELANVIAEWCRSMVTSRAAPTSP